MLVGKEPNQQRFTVHHDLLVQRSEFFKAARSSRWTQPDQPTTLVDHDPETFSTYLHCLYFGVDAIKDRLSLIAEQHDATSEKAANTDQRDAPAVVTKNDAEKDSDDSSCKGVLDGGEGQDMIQGVEGTTQRSPKRLTALIDDKETEVTATLFVGNLNLATAEKTLEKAFVRFGELRSVHIITSAVDGRSCGYGYVGFASAESAAKALQTGTGVMLDGRDLRLDPSGPHRSTADMLNQDRQSEVAQHQTDIESNATAETIEDEVSSINFNTSYDEENDSVGNAMTRVLIKLYMLADKLIDLHTANLVIDELVRHVDGLTFMPGAYFIRIVYQCTPRSGPLRALFRDWYIHEGDYTWDDWEDFNVPVEFLQDLISETGQIHNENCDRTIDKVFRTKAISRPIDHYHQKSGGSQSESGDGP